MKKDQKYFFKRCRLCGRCYKGSADIFSPNQKNLQELIHQCLNINVREDDALPKKLCQFCDKKLSLWEKFKNSCENVQVKLIADSLPKKVDIPKSKKSGKVAGSLECIPGISAKDNTCDSLIKIKPDYKWENDVGTNQSWSTTESIQNCVESAMAILGPKMEHESQIDNLNLLVHDSNSKDQPSTAGENGCSKHKNLANAPDNTIQNTSQGTQPKVLEITDQEINDLNDTISKNLNSDETFQAKKEEINNNVHMKDTDLKIQNGLSIKNLQRKQQKELRLKNKPLKEYHCSICKKTFHSLRKMKVHFKGHLTKSAELKHHTKRAAKTELQCPHCPRKLTTSFNLRHHLDTHSETCNYCCHLCGKLFRTHSSLLNHIRVHLCDEMKDNGKDSVILENGQSIKLFQCQICDKKFRQSGHLAYHLKMHTGERLYSCSDCGMNFTEKYQLRKHANAVHHSIKRYTCDVCGKQFLHTHNFRDHMLQHGGIASVSCDLCGKAFITSNALSRHRRLHTGEKPFSCDICGKTFRDCSNRKRHRDKHIKEAEEALAAKKPKEEEPTSPLSLIAAVEEAMGKASADVVAMEANGKDEKMFFICEDETEGKTKKTYMSLKTYFESNDVVSLRDEVKDGDELILPLESLVTAVSSQSAGLLQPLTVSGNIDDSSNPGPLLGGGLFGEELDLNSESLLLIGDGRVNSSLLEGAEADSDVIKDQLVWVPSSNGVQGGDIDLNGIQNGDISLSGIHGEDIALSGIQNGDIGLNGIQSGDIGLSGIQGGDITGILEVGMGLCSDFDVNSAIELDTGKDGLPDDFPSISEIKEVEENEKALDNVLCLQVF